MKIAQKNPATIWVSSLSSTTSVKNYTSMLNTLSRYLGSDNLYSHEWKDMTYIDLIKLKRTLIDKGVQPSSINTYLTAVKAVMRESWRLQQIDIETYMRIADVKRVKGQSATSGTALSKRELNDLINYENGSIIPREARDSAIISIAYGAGLRRQEIVNLNLSDFQEKRVLVHGKGGYTTFVYLPDFTIKRIQHWVQIRGNFSGPLFNRLSIGRVITEYRLRANSLSEIVDRRCKLSGVRRITPHDLRRSYATNLINSGVDLFTVQKLMRHSDIETTRRYDMRDEQVKANAVQLLPF